MNKDKMHGLVVGSIVHTDSGNYAVVGFDREEDGSFVGKLTPILVRCFRMRDHTRYSLGFRPPVSNRARRTK